MPFDIAVVCRKLSGKFTNNIEKLLFTIQKEFAKIADVTINNQPTNNLREIKIMAKHNGKEYADTIAINVAGQNLLGSFKEFKTKSVGYFASGKVLLPDGSKLQVSVNAVIIGTKPVIEEDEKTNKKKR